MWGIVIVCSLVGALSIEGRSFGPLGSEDGGIFSVFEDGSGGLEGVVYCFELFRRAHTEPMSIVAPEGMERLDFLDSSLWIVSISALLLH